MGQSAIKNLPVLLLGCLFVMGCTPTWYSRNSSTMLAYGRDNVVWNMSDTATDFELTARQLTAGVLIGNIADIDGNSDEISSRVLAIPAADLKTIGNCLDLAQTEYFFHKFKKQAAVRISWGKEFTCKISEQARSNLIALLPGQFGLPDMADGKMTIEAFRLLQHGLFRIPPVIDSLFIAPLVAINPVNLTHDINLEYTRQLLQSHGITITDEPAGQAEMYCKYWNQKLDQHSYHRMIYHLACQIISPEKNLLWEDETYLIPLLP